MGEYADDHIDRMFDDYFDREDDDDFIDGFFGSRPHAPRHKTCSRCGEQGLLWKHTGRGWKLADPLTMEPHDCGTPSSTADDFPNLDNDES